MVRKHLDGELGLGEVVSIVGEGVDNGVEFFVGAIPSLLAIFKLVMEEEYGAPLALVILLFNHARVGNVGGVGRKADLSFGVEGGEENIVADGSKKSVEGFLFLSVRGPGPKGIFLKKVVEARNSVRIVGNKFVIETDHSEEGAKVGDASWRFEIAERLDLVVGHPHAFTADDIKAEEVNLFSVPFAFVGLKSKFVLSKGIKDLGDMGFVFFHTSFGEHDNVI